LPACLSVCMYFLIVLFLSFPLSLSLSHVNPQDECAVLWGLSDVTQELLGVEWLCSVLQSVRCSPVPASCKCSDSIRRWRAFGFRLPAAVIIVFSKGSTLVIQLHFDVGVTHAVVSYLECMYLTVLVSSLQVSRSTVILVSGECHWGKWFLLLESVSSASYHQCRYWNITSSPFY
jgi:hypothetical protein